jgi:hypothetical protein
MTIQQLVDKCIEKGIPLDWELMLETPNEWFTLKGVSVIDQHEVGLVFEDHQRIISLNKDPEQWSIPSV